MYFPYLRGRQYELIALRELLDNPNYSQKIIPVIEPVKASPTLMSSIKAYIQKKRNLILIANPQVGTFNLEIANRKEFREKYDELLKSEHLQLCFLLQNDKHKDVGTLQQILDYCKEYRKERYYAVFYNHDSSKLLEEMQKECNIDSLFILDNTSVRRGTVSNRILLSDKFNKCSRNSDYAENTDEFFSEDHLYFKSDGFSGFGDYSTIGNEYVETGFAPLAVAIHMVYFDTDNSLRIRHFVSDDNIGREDTPKKFEQAINKLLDCEEIMKYKTKAYEMFLSYKENGKYPGLGTVKKLSIMHHLELISLFLDDKIK